MSFTYTRDIPFENNNPSNDQPNMKTNTNSTDNLLQVDHISFNDTNSGKHIHVTFPTSQSTPALGTSVTQIYPQQFPSGGTTYLETFTSATLSTGQQINGYLPFVKAIGRFVGTAGPFPKTLYDPTNSLGGGAVAGIANTLYANIKTVVQTDIVTAVITFTTNLPYNTYYVLQPDAQLTITKTTSTITAVALVTLNLLTFSVVVI